MTHKKTHHTKADTLQDLALLWPTDNAANIAQRMGYKSLAGLLTTLQRWPEGKAWEKRLQEQDTLQRGARAREIPFDDDLQEAS